MDLKSFDAVPFELVFDPILLALFEAEESGGSLPNREPCLVRGYSFTLIGQ